MKKVSKKLSGGGIDSKNRKDVGLRTGKPNRAINPGAVAQIGGVVGQNPEQAANGPSIQSNLGNALAEKVVCGPGGSRTVMACGTQGQHGQADKGRRGPDLPASPRPMVK